MAARIIALLILIIRRVRGKRRDGFLARASTVEGLASGGARMRVRALTS